MVVYHLHDLEEVVFSKSLEAICQFVHVDLVREEVRLVDVLSSPERILLGWEERNQTHILLRPLLLFRSSSPPAARFDFTPFSSPGTGPDSRSKANSAGLGFLNVCKDKRNEYMCHSVK